MQGDKPERVFPSAEYRHAGLRRLVEKGLPGSWVLSENAILRTEHDFHRMETVLPLLSLKTPDEMAVQIGVIRGYFKADWTNVEQAVLVCTVTHGEIWSLEKVPHAPSVEIFVNSNAEALEHLLNLRKRILESLSPASEFASLRDQFFSAEPTLATRPVSYWREFVDQCDGDYRSRS